MSKTTDIIHGRTARRHDAALAAWSAIKSELEVAGVEPRLFGSLATGSFASHSDIDLIVRLGESGLSRSKVDRIVSRASPDIQVDLFFEEDLTPYDLEIFIGT